MKKLLFASFLLISLIGFAQCPTSPITLSSQEEVDDFAVNYPGCANLLNDLTITGNDITNLSGLSQLVGTTFKLTIKDNPVLLTTDELNLEVNSSSTLNSIIVDNNPLLITLPNFTEGGLFSGGFSAKNNPSLLDLNGLLGLSSTGDITIDNCDGLINLAGLDNITYFGFLQIRNNDALQSISELGNVSGDIELITIFNNPQLINLNGLEGVLNTGVLDLSILNNDSLIDLDGLQNVTGGWGLTVSNNAALQSFEGLNSVVEYRSIRIQNNLSLADISNLETNLWSEIFDLRITGNTSLAACSLINFCNYLGNSGDSTIENNASGCNSSMEILDACSLNLNTISGSVKFDVDSDNCDVSDPSLSSMLVNINGGIDEHTILTNINGNYSWFVPQGTYTTSIVTDSYPNYFTVSPASVETIFGGSGDIEIVNFCLETNEVVNDLKVSFLPLSDARPGFDAEYQLVYENIGTTTLNGEVTLQFDDSRQTYLESTPSENGISTNVITWNYVDLLPFQSEVITVLFNNQPPPINNADDILLFEAMINPVLDDENPEDNTQAFQQIIVNSFDPNDKRAIQGSQILEAAVGDYLDYIVRFQNTGTADAINVRVEDILDANLNLETFRMLSSSHTYRVEITNGNEVAFIFDNIFLPPEVLDPEGSNGFIAFQVRTDASLSIGDTVENTADIYFDFNPAIVTNTVVTTVVENLAVSKFDLNSSISIYPNPVSEILHINASENITVKEVMVYSMLGKQLLISSENSLTVSNLSEGIYFIEISTNKGTLVKKIIKE